MRLAWQRCGKARLLKIFNPVMHGLAGSAWAMSGQVMCGKVLKFYHYHILHGMARFSVVMKCAVCYGVVSKMRFAWTLLKYGNHDGRTE